MCIIILIVLGHKRTRLAGRGSRSVRREKKGARGGRAGRGGVPRRHPGSRAPQMSTPRKNELHVSLLKKCASDSREHAAMISRACACGPKHARRSRMRTDNGARSRRLERRGAKSRGGHRCRAGGAAGRALDAGDDRGSTCARATPSAERAARALPSNCGEQHAAALKPT